jgi:Meckel syndrome type 1 protein
VPDAPSEALGASILPDWWPLAAGGAGALVVLGGAGLVWRRRQRRKPLRLAAPVAKPAAAADASPAAADLPRLDLALEITAATRSVMMFTLEYRLTIANRSPGAVNGLNVALQLACARASAGSGAGAGSAQAISDIARIGPHQAQTLTGSLQLPLSAITPLRQGATPLFVPLVHVTLEGDGQRALARSFVIGPPSASGRVHPISLDVPPGSIAGLKAQAIAIPAVSAAA